MYNVIIPLAGRGQRFKDAGYKKAKPFIDLVDGLPLIKAVIINIIDSIYTKDPKSIMFYFIVMPEHKEELVDILSTMNIQYYIVEQRVPLQGAAHSISLLLNYNIGSIDLSLPTIVANSDQLILDPMALYYAIRFWDHNECMGGILTFWNDNSKWSYAHQDQNGKVDFVAEKPSLPQHYSFAATTGIYYFKNGNILQYAINDMMDHNIQTNNEYYLAPCYNSLIGEDFKIMNYWINNMVGLGTPEDLQSYQKEIGHG